jgi:hypothetical protein
MICKSEEVIVSKAFRQSGMGCMHLNVEHVICSIAVRTQAYDCMTSMERCRVLFGLYALEAHIYANARPSQMDHAQPERRPWNRPDRADADTCTRILQGVVIRWSGVQKCVLNSSKCYRLFTRGRLPSQPQTVSCCRRRGLTCLLRSSRRGCRGRAARC